MDDPWDTNGNLTDIGIDFNDNFNWTTALENAKAGDAHFQYRLGLWHLDGTNRFVDIDKKKAVEWLTKAAEQEHENAKKVIEQIAKEEEPEHLHCYVCLADLNTYYCRNDCDKAAETRRKKAEENRQEGERILKTAEQGDAEAQLKAGYAYENGIYLPKDYAKAVEWWLKSAEQGNIKARCRLGFCYDKGKGVTQDHTKAVEWYQKAAEQGDTDAQCRLAAHYREGEGVTKDLDKAFELYKKAADQGDESAMYYLNEVRKERKWNW
jgi:TPR repeat protein